MIIINASQVQIDPKKVSVDSKKGISKSFSLSYRLTDEDTDTEQDIAYVTPCKKTPRASSQETRSTPQKVNPDVVTASQSNEERALIV